MPVSSPEMLHISNRSVTGAQAYHSAFNEVTDVRQVGNLAILPLKTARSGAAPPGASRSHSDICIIMPFNS